MACIHEDDRFITSDVNYNSSNMDCLCRRCWTDHLLTVFPVSWQHLKQDVRVYYRGFQAEGVCLHSKDLIHVEKCVFLWL